MAVLDGLADRLAAAVEARAERRLAAELDGFYECVECQRTADSPLTTCPDCEGLVVRVVEPDDSVECR